MGPQPIPQAGVIPWRVHAGVLELLLVTDSRRRRWQVPKGHLEPLLTARETAMQEAWEEAGIKGYVAAEPLGNWIYEKRGQELAVTLFEMRVDQMLERWPEMFDRKRSWFPYETALGLLADGSLRAVAARLAARVQPLLMLTPGPGSGIHP